MGFLISQNVGHYVKKQAKKNKEIIYGARAIQQQVGPFKILRDTRDYDDYSKRPRRSAVQLRRSLNRAAREKDYYVKEAMHPGTWKVMDKGLDRRKNTQDDFNVADYTKIPKPRPGTVRKGGVLYANISSVEQDKKKALADQEYQFRHKKDQYDYNLIQKGKKINSRNSQR